MKLVLENETYTVFSLLGDKRFQFKDRDTAIRKLRSMGVWSDAITEAFQDMKVKQNNVAHFGIEGTFMFTEYLKGKNNGF